MKNLRELSRFSESGKTFFFNHGTGDNGADYIAVNALYGKGQQQRIVLFQSQYLSFFKHLKQAIEQVAGITMGPVIELPEPPAPPVFEIPERCPKGHAFDQYRVSTYRDQGLKLFCLTCGELV